MMNTLTAPGAPKPLSYQAGLLGAAALIAAASLVVGNIATRDAIAQRRAEDLLASLGQVIPSEIHDNDLLAHPFTLIRPSGEEVTVYRALRGRQVAGAAFRVSGQGYAGTIELILGLDTRGKILGTRVLAHTETPGLGDRIELNRDDWILGFDGRSLGNPPAERWAVKKDGGDFDQFSGATITPRGVVGAIRDGLRFFRDQRERLVALASPPAGM